MGDPRLQKTTRAVISIIGESMIMATKDKIISNKRFMTVVASCMCISP